MSVYDYYSGYDFRGGRFSDPEISLFRQVDPKTSKLLSWSPYTYCLDNPVLFVDPSGAFPYTFYVRSFHPDASFGGGFMGDKRGFSNNPASSSRIGHQFTFDPANGSTTNKGFQNNGSMHAAGYVASGGMWGLGKESPRETGFEAKGGNGAYNIKTGYAGANPLTPAGVTPDIDVKSNFSIKEDQQKGIVSISAKITGDAFPSAEAFIADASGKSLFIGVSGLNGNDLRSLFGDFNRDMIEANFNISIDKKGNFTGVEAGGKNYSIDDWNKKFESQSAK